MSLNASPNAQSFSLPFRLNRRIEPVLQRWEEDDCVRRLWSADPSLWTGTDESQWMGWLTVIHDQLESPDRFAQISDEVRRAGFRHVLLIGMGGSSLCPEVLAHTFGSTAGNPRLVVLDSTHPMRIRAVQSSIRLEDTLIVVSSKSGTTLESALLLDYFLARLADLVAPAEIGRHVMAITDPGSDLEARGRTNGFRHVFPGDPRIGGRFSALSDFGMIPAALLGIDVGTFLRGAEVMRRACSVDAGAVRNPAVVLGVTMGLAAEAGADKVTFVISEPIASFGAWLEQLLAESLGKKGKGMIPVDGERLSGISTYGDDRIFVYFRLAEADNREPDQWIGALEESGRPVIRIEVPAKMDLAQEFYRWEFATAVAGAVMGLNPFDQPDVEATKAATRSLMAAYEASGELPRETPSFEDEIASVFGGSTAEPPTLEDCLAAHIGLLEPGEYAGLLAYLDMSGRISAMLERIRERIRTATSNAVTIGFGPRFLHSTGQAHKGGPNRGVFFVFTSETAPAVDLDVPGRPYSFGLVIAAQARGDSDALLERGRRVLRIHLRGEDPAAALESLDQAFERALRGVGDLPSDGP